MSSFQNEAARHLALLELAWIHARDGKLAINTDNGIILAANPAFCQMTGYAAEDILGTHVANLHP